jgi:hypothetical protein
MRTNLTKKERMFALKTLLMVPQETVVSVIHTSTVGSLIRVQVPNAEEMLSVQERVRQFNLACEKVGRPTNVAIEFDVLSTMFVQA